VLDQYINQQSSTNPIIPNTSPNIRPKSGAALPTRAPTTPHTAPAAITVLVLRPLLLVGPLKPLSIFEELIILIIIYYNINK